MKVIFLVLSGFVSGVIAGMGMGGGTVLLPILTLFFGIDQHVAQATNLVVFLPMATIAVLIYLKKGMIDKKLWWILCLKRILLKKHFPKVSLHRRTLDK